MHLGMIIPRCMNRDTYRSYWGFFAYLAVGVIFFLGGCSTGGTSTSGDTLNQSPIDGYIPCAAILSRTQPIQCLVLHHTATSLPSSIETLRGKTHGHKVGTHYLVSDETKPRVFRMAHECFSTSHAGKSKWKEFGSLNQSSIGIEIVNLDGNLHSYPPAQVAAIIRLCQDIVKRNNISPSNVVAHSDIAIGRKVDPGSKFPWEQLAAAGVGAWPDADELARCTQLYQAGVPPPHQLREMFKAYGYRFDDNSAASLRSTVEAFQRHFRGRKVDGLVDVETVAILAALNLKYHKLKPSIPSLTTPAAKKN